MGLTKKFCEPLWLVVVLNGNGARVEEDEDDDEPEPPLLLAHLADLQPHPRNRGPKLARGACKITSKDQLFDMKLIFI